MLEELEEEARQHGITIIYHNFNSDRLKGLYCDKTILLSKKLGTSAEKACVLAEELGHYFTSVGNIIDPKDLHNCKQEQQARLWAYNRMFGLRGLVRAYENGCREDYELAEYLNVPAWFLQEALQCYSRKYGEGVAVDAYNLSFIPCLQVRKSPEAP